MKYDNLYDEVLDKSRGHLREMSKEERNMVMECMSDNFDSQENPEVGIFWYDEKKDALFGVSKSFADELQFNSNGLKTVRILHQQWWQKEKNKRLSKGEDLDIFNVDYTQIPRGRVFQRKDGTFQLMCGSWITEHIEKLVKEEFNLQNVPFEVKIDEHWEIGHGWSEEYN
ncbi:hypothetical protein [Treponema sp. R6D11]